MYYTLPPRLDVSGSGANIGIASSKDLVNWSKVGEITPENSRHADLLKKELHDEKYLHTSSSVAGVYPATRKTNKSIIKHILSFLLILND